MGEIKGSDLVVSAVGRWHPSDLAYIESLQYTAGTEKGQAELILDGVFQCRESVRGGWPSEVEPKFKVTLRFIGVKKLQLKDFGGFPTQIMGFEIVDISKNGWEDIRFSVGDYENDRIRFFCKQLEIINVIHAQ